MGSGGYKGDFDSLEDAMTRVDKLFKSLIKELAKDKDVNYKPQVMELQRLYKRNYVELKVKLDQFKRKNTWLNFKNLLMIVIVESPVVLQKNLLTKVLMI